MWPTTGWSNSKTLPRATITVVSSLLNSSAAFRTNGNDVIYLISCSLYLELGMADDGLGVAQDNNS